jgi:TonB family protein
MKTIILLSILLLAGCPPVPDHTVITPPSNIEYMTTVPPVTNIAHGGKLELTVYFLVLKNGTVEEVSMQTKSGDPRWDSAVVDSLKRWRFVALPDESPLNSRWLRYTIHVEIAEPVFMNLGEIIALNRTEADSLYLLLRQGVEFTALAQQHREGTTEEVGKMLGTVNISQYPEYVRKELVRLRVCRFTRPIQVGDMYIIYKRFRN